MHAVIEEICRVRHGDTVRPDVLRRWQAALRCDVQPLLDERDALIEQTAALREQIAELSKARKGKAA